MVNWPDIRPFSISGIQPDIGCKKTGYTVHPYYKKIQLKIGYVLEKFPYPNRNTTKPEPEPISGPGSGCEVKIWQHYILMYGKPLEHSGSVLSGTDTGLYNNNQYRCQHH
jgi:hypothetical protein